MVGQTTQRSRCQPVADGKGCLTVGTWHVDPGGRPGALTAAGWLAGVGACAAAALRLWPLALALWLSNRLLDGLDGPVARLGSPTERGGFLDIVADFSVYGGFVVGVAIGVPASRLACVVLLAAYYVSGTALLALSSLTERRALPGGDERSLQFAGGLAEGTETVAVYVLPAPAAGGRDCLGVRRRRGHHRHAAGHRRPARAARARPAAVRRRQAQALTQRASSCSSFCSSLLGLGTHYPKHSGTTPALSAGAHSSQMADHEPLWLMGAWPAWPGGRTATQRPVTRR
jgi:phosphatidylglycerophosphate synthase